MHVLRKLKTWLLTRSQTACWTLLHFRSRSKKLKRHIIRVKSICFIPLPRWKWFLQTWWWLYMLLTTGYWSEECSLISNCCRFQFNTFFLDFYRKKMQKINLPTHSNTIIIHNSSNVLGEHLPSWPISTYNSVRQIWYQHVWIPSSSFDVSFYTQFIYI